LFDEKQINIAKSFICLGIIFTTRGFFSELHTTRVGQQAF